MENWKIENLGVSFAIKIVQITIWTTVFTTCTQPHSSSHASNLWTTRSTIRLHAKSVRAAN